VEYTSSHLKVHVGNQELDITFQVQGLKPAARVHQAQGLELINQLKSTCTGTTAPHLGKTRGAKHELPASAAAAAAAAAAAEVQIPAADVEEGDA
jgi:hypothetical protein